MGFGWHSIFVVPIAAMAVLAVLGFFFVKNLETSEAHLDVPSVVLPVLVLTALSYGLAQLTIEPLVAGVSLVLCVALAAAFVVRQLRCDHPLIDLTPVKSRAFWPALVLATVAMMSTFSMSVLLPLYFEGGAGMTALMAGLIILVPVLVNEGAIVGTVNRSDILRYAMDTCLQAAPDSPPASYISDPFNSPTNQERLVKAKSRMERNGVQELNLSEK